MFDIFNVINKEKVGNYMYYKKYFNLKDMKICVLWLMKFSGMMKDCRNKYKYLIIIINNIRELNNLRD